MDGTKANFLHAYCRRSGRAYLRFDYSGHGLSGGKYSETTILDWYRETVLLIRAVATGPQLLVGSSMGAWIGVLLAERFPELVSGFVGIASAPDFTVSMESELTKAQRADLVSNGHVDIPSDYDDEPTRFSSRFFVDGRGLQVTDKNIVTRFPVRLLHGTSDEVVDYRLALKLLHCLDGDDVRLTLVRGACHRMSDEAGLDMLRAAIDSM